MYNKQIKVKVSNKTMSVCFVCTNILRTLSETEVIKVFQSMSEQNELDL